MLFILYILNLAYSTHHMRHFRHPHIFLPPQCYATFSCIQLQLPSILISTKTDVSPRPIPTLLASMVGGIKFGSLKNNEIILISFLLSLSSPQLLPVFFHSPLIYSPLIPYLISLLTRSLFLLHSIYIPLPYASFTYHLTVVPLSVIPPSSPSPFRSFLYFFSCFPLSST